MSYIAWSPVRKYMSQFGAEIVARDAVDFLIDFLESKAKFIANESKTITNFAQRKKIATKDIIYVLNQNFSFIPLNESYNKDESVLSFSPMRRLFKDEGCNIVAGEAIDMVNLFLESCIEAITKKCIELLKYVEDRKKIAKRDIKFVINDLFNKKQSNTKKQIIIKDTTKKTSSSTNNKDYKICKFCGNKCSPNAKMCPKCGDPF